MADSLLTVFAEVRAIPGKEDAALKVLKGLIEPTRKEEGCVAYLLHVNNDEQGHFVFYEIWKSKAHLEAHLATPHMQAFLARSKELLAKPLRVVFTRLVQ